MCEQKRVLISDSGEAIRLNPQDCQENDFGAHSDFGESQA